MAVMGSTIPEKHFCLYFQKGRLQKSASEIKPEREHSIWGNPFLPYVSPCEMFYVCILWKSSSRNSCVCCPPAQAYNLVLFQLDLIAGKVYETAINDFMPSGFRFSSV